MKPLSLSLLVCVGFLAGCGEPVAPKVDPDEARTALRTALEAWKSGQANSELESLRPPLLMNESDWTGGNRLLEYRMEEAGRVAGRQVRWVVWITLQDANGKKAPERKATYVIDTVPRIVIVRDSFAR
jgi:hypothetical protein